MKFVKWFILPSSFLFILVLSFAQDNFSSCAAAYLGQEMIVDNYSPRGKASLSKNTLGKLQLYTISGDENGWNPMKNITFKIAIRDAQTNTLNLFSDQTYKNIEVGEVLSQCKKGDSIVLLTTEKTYALPHNEILVK